MARDMARALEEQLDAQMAGPLQTVDVAILDSGIDATHPDLASRVTKAYGAELDHGRYQMVEREPGSHDAFGHGTAVASIIARMAPNARLVDYAILGRDNTGAGAALVAALAHAVDAGHRVINMSLAAKGEFATQLHPLCETAYRRGIVIVAAKRNMPLSDQGFPAEFTSVVSVDRAKFATPDELRYVPGKVIEFVGHGDDVVVAAPGGMHTTKTGTSFATPAVAGIVAKLLGAYPELRPFQVKTALHALSQP